MTTKDTGWSLESHSLSQCDSKLLDYPPVFLKKHDITGECFKSRFLQTNVKLIQDIKSYYVKYYNIIITLVFFKHLGSRHIHKNNKIPKCMYRINRILCKTALKPIQRLSLNIINDVHFEAKCLANFENCLFRKSVTFSYAMTSILTDSCYWIQ